jgi:hypothetical protein
VDSEYLLHIVSYKKYRKISNLSPVYIKWFKFPEAAEKQKYLFYTPMQIDWREFSSQAKNVQHLGHVFWSSLFYWRGDWTQRMSWCTRSQNYCKVELTVNIRQCNFSSIRLHIVSDSCDFYFIKAQSYVIPIIYFPLGKVCLPEFIFKILWFHFS